MQAIRGLVAAFAVAAAVVAGCQTAPKSDAKKANLEDQAQTVLSRFQREDPGFRDMADKARGYAIFPDVGKGGVIVGGAYGKGVLFDQGQMTGYADLTQASIGAQLGGQTFAEVILFENQEALDRFKNNQLAFAANASAVAIKAGASKAARYENGVAVFTQPNGGLMFEASVGGQKFTYTPAGDGPGASTQRAATRTSTTNPS